MATPGTARLLVISQIAGKSGLFCLVALDGGKARQIRCQPFRAAFPLPIGSVRGSATRWQSFAVASRYDFNCRKDFLPAIAPKACCRAGPWAFYKLREDGVVPVICPTCQNVFALKASMPAPPSYFAWGCFRYFLFRFMARRRARRCGLSRRWPGKPVIRAGRPPSPGGFRGQFSTLIFAS
jgi:hypothetical protein